MRESGVSNLFLLMPLLLFSCGWQEASHSFFLKRLHIETLVCGVYLSKCKHSSFIFCE